MGGIPEDFAPQGQPSNPAMAEHKLRSLAPVYRAEHHLLYAEHLERAIEDTDNWNIALTGRYGTGKSSVLDEFARRHEGNVLRISITTLGPDRDGESLTNRIQKELVKQLIYRLDPGEVRTSRFARTNQIAGREAAQEGAIAVAVLGLFLGLAGWLPTVASLPDDLSWSWSSLGASALFAFLWLLFFGSAVVLATWVRRALDSRIVTSLSTAGTSITLGEKDDTYFDAYLDELVTHFDRGRESFVILEDLDRFDDPAIFDSLRELNTILNSSSRRKVKTDGEPLRFVYAIRDSLFERIKDSTASGPAGAGQAAIPTEPGSDDESNSVSASALAAAEDPSQKTLDGPDKRANRTKFFDIVIPMVPFLSHRNARDVLDAELANRSIPEGEVSRTLLSLVARHATDMRLLLNILNEYTVFAQRLLWVKEPAPGLTGNLLFALVAYKNFNLADFEAIPVRGSALDALDRAHRDLVRHAVSTRQARRTKARNAVLTHSQQSALAEALGRELVHAANYAIAASGALDLRPQFTVGSQGYDAAGAATIKFWAAVAENNTLTVGGARQASAAGTSVQNFNQLSAEALEHLFPKAMEDGVWEQAQDDAVRRRIQELDAEIDFLRGASYAQLLERSDYTTVDDRTFTDLLEQHLDSELARELVRQGYINRNFATYSAAFYGTFAGIDAETFYYRAVQPNEMLLDHRFSSEESLSNLLDQLDREEPGFYNTISVLNPQIVTYLLLHRLAQVRSVVSYIASHYDDNARGFLISFLAEQGAPHDRLIAALAAHPWHGLFDELLAEWVSDAQRLDLVDSALQSATDENDYALGEEIRTFIAENYAQMKAFTAPQSDNQAEVIRDFAATGGVQVQGLEDVPQPLRRLLVAAHRYDLTGNNLRAALGVDGSVALDSMVDNPIVWTHCTTDLRAYLEVVKADADTEYVVEQPDTLLKLLELCDDEQSEGNSEQLDEVLAYSSPDSIIQDLAVAPGSTWTALAQHRRFALTVSNLDTYIARHGDVDQALAEHLTADGAVISIAVGAEAEETPGSEEDSDDAEDASDSGRTQRLGLAVKLLNASKTLSAANRAELAAQLDVGPSDLALDKLEPASDDLLAEALDRGLLEPNEETFTRFASAGWGAVARAVMRHRTLEGFVQPSVVDDTFLTALLGDDAASRLHQHVLDNFDAFIPAGPEASTELHVAAARRAVQMGTQIHVEHINRIADHTSQPDLVVPLLAVHRGLDGDQLVAILVKLDAPYDQVGPGHEKFLVPDNDAARTVFGRLEREGKGTLSTSKGKTFFAPE